MTQAVTSSLQMHDTNFFSCVLEYKPRWQGGTNA